MSEGNLRINIIVLQSLGTTVFRKHVIYVCLLYWRVKLGTTYIYICVTVNKIKHVGLQWY